MGSFFHTPVSRAVKAWISRRGHHDQFRPRGIEMDVIAHALEIAAARAFEDQRFAATGEEMPNSLCGQLKRLV